MKKYNIFVILIMFLFLYEPPIFNINILHILGLFSWIYIFINYKNLAYIIKVDKVIYLYAFFIFAWTYILLICLINSSAIANSFHFVYWMIDIIPICISFCIYFTKKNYSFIDLMNILLVTGIVQATLALLSFYVPSVKEFFLSQLLDYGYRDVLVQLSDVRLFGFASNLTFSTPIVQSILGVISLYLALNRNWKYIFFAPLLFFSGIINARTSIVILLIGLLAIIFFVKKINVKTIVKTIIISFILILISNLGLTIVEEKSYDTYKWISTGYEEIKTAIFEGTNQTEGYFSYINDVNKYVLPENFGLIFGVGERILTFNQYGVRSDIGYINDIWFGGFLYSILIYSLFIKLIFSMKAVNESYDKLGSFLTILFLGAFVVSNIKGYIFSMNNLTNLLFIIFSFTMFKKKLYSKKNR